MRNFLFAVIMFSVVGCAGSSESSSTTSDSAGAPVVDSAVADSSVVAAPVDGPAQK
jgi:hypothetical protein